MDSLRFDIPLGGVQAKAEGGEIMNRMEQGIDVHTPTEP